MSGSLQSFLLDTLVWTGGLIALVLVLRRPVARHFGAQAAYVLWFVPLVRLMLPPLELPAWLKPAGEAAAPVATLADAPPAAMLAAYPVEISAAALPQEPPFDFATPLLALWLAGAAVFLVRRFALYFQMRRELLDGARPVGEEGRIRLVESPAIAGPVAFGVRDKVIALPPGFMASPDRRARDLALAHELAHHKGRDLLVNFLVQPLFALHWFNPLGALGWSAMRRDQEAACDVRVMAASGREERALYAGVIAGFACLPGAAPRAALAAPMACPVLGDKSIIHRLRSLSMSNVSPRRRLAARLAFGTALLALPLTASISYAESAQDAPPPPPEAPLRPEAPLAPEAPRPPEAPTAPEAIDPDDAWADGEHRLVVRRVVRDGEAPRIERRVIHRDDEMTAEERAEFERDMAEMREELHRELGENGEMRREIHLAVAEARAGARAAAHAAPRVVMECKDDDQPVTTRVDADGTTTMFVCESYGDRVALKSLKQARDTIARNRHMSSEVRAEVLDSLDEEIEQLSE